MTRFPFGTYNEANCFEGRNRALADELDKSRDVERLGKQLDGLDKRLDNVDSIVTAVAERIMKQPVTLTMTCPHCGRKIEIALLGTEKPTH